MISHRETDLWIGVSGEGNFDKLPAFVLKRLKFVRSQVDAYGEGDDRFLSAMSPYRPDGIPPPPVERMFAYGQRTGVGPMASVAGVFAEGVGEALMHEFGMDECIVENGGDLYLNISEPVTVSIFAGNSPLSNRVILHVDPRYSPLGICTSSGTVGHSFSYGCADAVTIACQAPGLADAYATAVGNMIRSKNDIEPVLDVVGTKPEILSVVIIVDDRLGIRGYLPMARVHS
jgi:ApbE superfamily uncharacterized protein (UPF0280 family)